MTPLAPPRIRERDIDHAVQVDCPLCHCRTTPPGGHAWPESVARAVQWMIDHHGDPAADVGQMAAHAGISSRRLQDPCRIHFGATPGQLLREVRLYRARVTLLRARPGWGTVTAIAAQVGYRGPGRLGKDYRARFGETPTTTLRRAVPVDTSAEPLALASTLLGALPTARGAVRLFGCSPTATPDREVSP